MTKSDEPYERYNLAKPVEYRSSNDGIDEEVAIKNLEEMINVIRLLSLGKELNRRRSYLEQKLNIFNVHHHSGQPQGGMLAQGQNPPFVQEHQLKRAIDPIGGANLLKRAVDRIGGGNLLRRR